jgi:hypothetical protein
MEQCVSYSFIYYRGQLYKRVAIFLLVEPIYNQKTFVLMNKMFSMNTVIRFNNK